MEMCGPSPRRGVKTPVHFIFPLTSFQDRTHPQGRGQSSPPWSARGSTGLGDLCFSSPFQLGVSGFTLLPGFLDLLRMNSPIPASPPLPPPCSLCPRGMLTAGEDRQYFYHDLRAASVVVSQEGAAGM